MYVLIHIVITSPDKAKYRLNLQDLNESGKRFRTDSVLQNNNISARLIHQFD